MTPGPAIIHRRPLDWLLLAGLVALAALALPPLLMTAFVQPQADDFCTNFRIQQDGFASLQWARWNGISGRYTAMAVQGLVGEVSVHSGRAFVLAYQAGCAVLQLLFAGALFWLARAFAPFTRSQALLVALAGLVAMVSLVPRPVEILFWLSGGTVHLMAIILWLLWLGAVVRHGRKPTRWSLILALLLGFLVPGGSEMALAASWASLAFILLRTVLDQGAAAVRRVVVLAVPVASGTLLSLGAPGNWARARLGAGTAGGWAKDLGTVPASLADLLVLVAGNPVVWGLLLVLAALAGLAGANERRGRMRGIWWLVPPAALAVVTVIFLISAYSGETAARTVAAGVILATIALSLTGSVLLAPVVRAQGASRPVLAAGLLLLVGAAAASANGRLYIDHLRGPARAFSEASASRYAAIGAHGPADSVTVEPLFPRPAGLLVSELNADPGHWVNRCMARFFGVRQVCLAGTC